MNNHKEEKWLTPLKNRPDIEPDDKFVRDLKIKLLKPEVKNIKRKTWDLKMLVPLCVAVFLFSIITLSFLDSNNANVPQQSQEPENPEDPVSQPIIDNKEDVGFDIEKLTSDNDAYKKVYEDILEVLGTDEESKKLSALVVYYLEALRLQDKELVDEYAFQYTDLKKTSKLMDFYKNIDFSTIKVENIYPTNEPVYQIYISYYEKNKTVHRVSGLLLDQPNHKINDNSILAYGDSPLEGGEDLELTDSERRKYEQYKEEHYAPLLIELHPISIAKMYIQAGIDGDWETQYELYTTRKDHIMWSKEEHKGFSEKEKETPEQIKERYAGLSEGIFIQTSEINGYISFRDGEQGFQMVKDENGVWKVSFMQIQ